MVKTLLELLKLLCHLSLESISTKDACDNRLKVSTLNIAMLKRKEYTYKSIF